MTSPTEQAAEAVEKAAWAHVSNTPRPEQCTDWNKVFSSETFKAGAAWALEHDPRVVALVAALNKAHTDLVHFLNYGNFKGANFSTESASCVDGRVEWDAGYIVDALSGLMGGGE